MWNSIKWFAHVKKYDTNFIPLVQCTGPIKSSSTNSFIMMFNTTGKTDVDQYPAAVSLSLPGSGSGTTLAVFHTLVNLPFEIDSLESMGAVLAAVY